jgi:hypothetical protein
MTNTSNGMMVMAEGKTDQSTGSDEAEGIIGG